MRLSLSKRGEYAVRMGLHLAGLPPGMRVTAAELGYACRVPQGNVPTVVNLLSRAGVLSCSPGRHGGCELGRPADAISLLEVIEAVEGPLGAQCLLDGHHCVVKKDECALHRAWVAGREAVLATLGHLSLEDVARRLGTTSAAGWR